MQVTNRSVPIIKFCLLLYSTAAHLRLPLVTQSAKTTSAMSLMDCMNQGGGTVLLESYESSCDETVPLHPTPTVPLDKGTTMEVDTQGDSSMRREESPSAAAVSDTVATGSEAHESRAGEVKREEEKEKGNDLHVHVATILRPELLDALV